MTEVLSQDEIDALLNAISSGETDVEEIKDVGEQRKVKIYDFKRPDKFSKDHIRTLQMMHETFARLTTTSLSAQLRALVHVHVASVDQLTYEEFIRSIPNPTTLAIINMDPLKGSAVLEVDPSISFTVIDRLFGGSGDTPKLSRELTEIEQSVMEGIIVRILGNLREAWSNVIDLRPRLGNIETNPQFAQIVPPNDMVVLITLETKLGEVEGMLNLCIPYITIEPIIVKLTQQLWYSAIRRSGTTENLGVLKDKIEDVKVDITAEVGSTSLTVKETLVLKVGDIIKLVNHKIDHPFMLKVGKQRKFHCRPGRVGKQLAVQITGKVEGADELLLPGEEEVEEL